MRYIRMVEPGSYGELLAGDDAVVHGEVFAVGASEVGVCTEQTAILNQLQSVWRYCPGQMLPRPWPNTAMFGSLHFTVCTVGYNKRIVIK